MIYPRMTYYTRVVDNATGEQVLGLASTAQNKNLLW